MQHGREVDGTAGDNHQVEKRFTLRMDDELFNKIAELAKRHRRSTGKEIEEAVSVYVGLLHNTKKGR